jgi:hypothetical protein
VNKTKSQFLGLSPPYFWIPVQTLNDK